MRSRSAPSCLLLLVRGTTLVVATGVWDGDTVSSWRFASPRRATGVRQPPNVRSLPDGRLAVR